MCTGYYLQTTSRSQLGRVKRDCEVARAILKVLKEHIPGKVEGNTLFFVTLQKFPADVGSPFVTKGCSFREALRNKESGAFVIGKFCWLACARVFLVSVLIFTVVYHTILCITHNKWPGTKMDKTVNDVYFYMFVQVLLNSKLCHFHLCEFITLLSTCA